MPLSVVTLVYTIHTPSAKNVLIKVQGRTRGLGRAPWPHLRVPPLRGGLKGGRDVNVLIFLDFTFSCYSVHQKYKFLKRYVAQCDSMTFYGID